MGSALYPTFRHQGSYSGDLKGTFAGRVKLERHQLKKFLCTMQKSCYFAAPSNWIYQRKEAAFATLSL